ncbi:hypothetical protein K438DRAFT_1927095 [Mycena galopus ATCC 62051]|nr:hypothetical protein K438DRAFT_1927095 [Mycena galopus ATCC 62051]
MCLGDNSATLSARYLNAQLKAMWENAVDKDHFDFENLEVAFRVKFSRRTLGGKDTRIGSGTHLIQMMVLDFASAQMVLFHPDLPAGTADSLEWYLRKYLTFLQNAGHHVRFDSPTSTTPHGALTDKVSGCLSKSRATGFRTLISTSASNSPARVRALCKHEVVLYFTAANVFFFESQDFASLTYLQQADPVFENWEFAFIVNVVEDKFNETAEPSLRIDISSARFCRHLSTIFAEEVNLHFTYLITFFQEHYLNLLFQYEMISIYYPGGKPDFEAPGFEEIEESSEWKEIKEGSTSTTVVVWTDIVKEIKLYGYDHLIAISEVSINALFDNLRKTVGGCLVEWSYEGFYAQFSDMRVKLLSGNQALVTFTIESGYLTPDDGYQDGRPDRPTQHGDWVAHYGGLTVSVGGGGIYRTVRHVILDFANANTFSSTHPSPECGTTISSRSCRKNRHRGELRVPREAPVLIVYGMMSGRPMPQAVIQWGHGWVVPGRIPSHGTVVLSRESFLESKLLAMLEVVNRRTTVVPRFPRADEEEWRCTSPPGTTTTTAGTNAATGRRLPRSIPAGSSTLGSTATNGPTNTKARTTRLSPTLYSATPRINFAFPPRTAPVRWKSSFAESVLRLKSKDNKDHSNWTKRSSAKWSVKMNVNTDASGLRVTLAEQVHPVFDKTESEGTWDIDTHELLATHLPRIIDVGEVINGLKDVFEGAGSCLALVQRPTASNGDIIIQLGGFVELAPTKISNSVPASPFKLQPARSAGSLSPMKPFCCPILSSLPRPALPDTSAGSPRNCCSLGDDAL